MLKTICLLTLLAVAPATQPMDAGTEQVIDAIMKKAGVDVWPSVTRIEFTFNVEDDGKLVVSRKHEWDTRAGTDRITDQIKKGEPVTADLSKQEPKEAYQQWTNDSYWLLMPLKLKDAGVQFGPMMMTRDYPPSRAGVTMSFAGVGLTPGDQYQLAIDLRNNQIDHWVYMPKPGVEKGFTWEDYKDFNGLRLATNHVSDDKKRRIYFTDIKVERE